MVALQRLFAAYYLYLMKLRRFNRRNKVLKQLDRGGTEDYGAMLFVNLTVFYLLFIGMYILKLVFGFNTSIRSPETKLFVKLIAVGICLISAYWSNKYFISDRKRRNLFFENFEQLPEQNKIFWKRLALFFMLMPVWALIVIVAVKYLK